MWYTSSYHVSFPFGSPYLAPWEFPFWGFPHYFSRRWRQAWWRHRCAVYHTIDRYGGRAAAVPPSSGVLTCSQGFSSWGIVLRWWCPPCCPIGDTRHYITCHPLSDFPRGASPIHSVEVATGKPPYGVDRFVGSHYVGRLIDLKAGQLGLSWISPRGTSPIFLFVFPHVGHLPYFSVLMTAGVPS